MGHVDQADRWIRAKFGRGVQRAAAQFHFVHLDEVRTAYKDAYGENGSSPFIDPRTRPYHVWIPYDHKEETVVVHEVMHLYGMWYTRTFPAQYRKNINEGVTEYLTRLAINERRDNYAAEYAEVAALVKHIGSYAPMCQAFFQGCFAHWQAAAGPMTFVRWSEKMAAGDWAGARKVLQKPPDKPAAVQCGAQQAGR